VCDQAVAGELHQSGTAEEVDYGVKMLLKQCKQFAVRDVSCRHDEQRAWLARKQMALSEVSVLGDKYPLVVIGNAGNFRVISAVARR
jgi:hypothetical protein